jgi:hypothetical protein
MSNMQHTIQLTFVLRKSNKLITVVIFVLCQHQLYALVQGIRCVYKSSKFKKFAPILSNTTPPKKFEV